MPRRKKLPPTGFSEEGARSEAKLPDRIDIQVGPGGRIVIPAVYRKAMGVEEGGRLMARMDNGVLRLLTPEMAIKRAQEWVRKTIPPGVSLVEDLFEERRREFEREASDD